MPELSAYMSIFLFFLTMGMMIVTIFYSKYIVHPLFTLCEVLVTILLVLDVRNQLKALWTLLLQSNPNLL